MIRILHIVGYMNRAGQETFLMNLYRHIDRSQVQFDFVVQSQGPNDYDAEIYQLGGRIYRLPAIYENPIKRFFELRRLTYRCKYKVVHRHTDKSLEWVDLLAAKLGGAKVRIVHSHSSSSKYKTLHKLCRPLMNYLSTHKFACSQLAAQWLYGDKPVQKKQVTIINNGIDTSSFRYNAEIRQQYRNLLGLEKKFVLGHVGRFCYAKNHEFLIHIFHQVHLQNPKARLLLVGDGELKEQVMQQVSILGLDQVVLFLGVRDDVNCLMQAMDVFVLPSLFEGLGIVLIEAQASGLPIVCSDTIPNEAFIIENIHVLSLLCDARKWVGEICDPININIGRKQAASKVQDAGYEIDEVIKQLENIWK